MKLQTPVNIAAERAVLSGLLQFGKDSYINICDIITPDCFTNTDNQIIFKCIVDILNTSDTVDIPSIISTATKLGFSETIQSKENAEYLRSLFNFPSVKENVKENAVILKKLTFAREGQKITRDIYSKLSNVTGQEKMSEIMSIIESPILNFGLDIDNDGEKTEIISSDIDKYIEKWSESGDTAQGIPSPIQAYNEAIGGGRRRGGVYLIAARPKSFKSQTALNDCLFCAGTLNIPVLYLDTEMSVDGQLPRIMANLTNMPINDIEGGKFSSSEFHKTKVIEAAQKLKSMPIYYRRVAGMPFGEILSVILRFVKENVGTEHGRTKDCLVIYDYFKLMDSSVLKEMQEYQAMGFQISALTDFCGKYDIPVSAYVQLNRQDDISQSDRLLWLCSSYSFLQRKTTEELLMDGPSNGNVKLYVTPSQRYGGGLDDGDYINLIVQGEKAIVKEGLLKSQLSRKNKQETGFQTIDENNGELTVTGLDDGMDVFSDDDFDEPAKAYRDDQYRK